MVELTAKTPCAGLLPVAYGALTLRELAVAHITSVAPLKGQHEAVSSVVKSAVGAGLPDPGRALKGAKGEVVWSGKDQFFVLDAELPKLNAATTDQSDAWAVVALEGEGAAEVLARLCPLDFGRMAEGDAARSRIGHMSAVIIARSDGYDLMVFRSMAKTLVHELSVAMKGVASRAAL
ncbi:MAG: sarcosine oxidase subunit gamma [Litoreibacter sp.]|nr:sarcosine oxidase subunit gamma [Litoreibacter sp.]